MAHVHTFGQMAPAAAGIIQCVYFLQKVCFAGIMQGMLLGSDLHAVCVWRSLV